MTHAEFILFVAHRKASIIHALLRGALPPGAHFAVFIQLAQSDDADEEPLTGVVSDVGRERIAQLVQGWSDLHQPSGAAVRHG